MVYAPPSVFGRDELSRQALQRALGPSSRDRAGVRYAYWNTIKRLNAMMAQLRRVCVREGVPMWDARGAFRDALASGQSLFYDEVHLTPAGNDLLARFVAQRLIEQRIAMPRQGSVRDMSGASVVGARPLPPPARVVR